MRLNLYQIKKFNCSSRRYTSVSKTAAIDLFQAGQHVKAAELLSALMKEQNSTDPEVLGALAVCLCQIPSKFVEAEALAKKACYIGNDDPDLVFKQGHVLREVGKADQAVKLLTNFLKREPHNWECHYQLGLSLNRNWMRFSAGILHFNQAIEINPNYLDTYYWRGESYFWLDTSPVKGDAFEWLQLVSNNDVNSIRKEFYRGLKSYHSKDYHSAITHFEKAQVGWKTGMDSYDLDSWRGEAYLAVDDFSNAMTSFEKALAKNPRDALSLHGKGTVLKKQGKESEGNTALHQALEVDRLYFKQDYLRVKEPIQKGV